MTTYPTEYASAIQEAFDVGEFRIPCTTPDEARRLRQNFYAYKYHLERQRSELFPIVSDLSFSIDGHDLVLRRQHAIGVSAIRRALGEPAS